MASKNKTKITAEKGRQEFIIEREFEAPRELVFKAFKEPELIVQWLGPNRMKMKIERFDNTSGGAYRFVHIDDKGREYGFNGVFHEMCEPERIIRTFEFEGLPERGHVSLETATFKDLPGGRSLLTMHCVFKSVADRDGMINSGMEGGMNEGLEKLDNLLETLLVKS
jgi:uncharacterized protein YndB with AHSA1/START domain